MSQVNKIDHECVSVDSLVQFAVEETGIVVQRTVTQNPAGSKWEGEAQHELAGLIQNAVSQKRSKLEKSGVPQQCRDIVLLLYDAYMYGSTEDAKLALQNVHGYDWFPSVFWAASFADSQMKGSSCIPKKIYGPGNLRCPPHQSSTAPSGAYTADCNTFC